MPVFKIKKINSFTTLGIWEIQEEVDFLLSKLILDDEERKLYNSFANDLRRKHWLSYRNLIKSLIPDSTETKIIYDVNGKPHLKNQSHFLSVSHAASYSAAIISESVHVGIDIEKIHPRIEKIIGKYLNQYETEKLGTEHRLEKLYIFWSAKEALYKMYGKRNLLFKEHMTIEPFEFNSGGGRIEGKISNNIIHQSFELFYEIINEYILVYVLDKDNLIYS